MENQFKKGTTTVGIICNDCVVIGADKRASMGFLIANKNVDKIIPITDKIAMSIAGMAADGQKLAKYLKAEMELYEMSTGIPPSLTVAANLLSNIVFSKAKSFIPYFVQLILAGKDDDEFSLYSLDMGGTNIKEQDYTSTGSGSPIAFGVLENSYKSGMSEEEGITLIVKALDAAMKRDMASGDGMSVFVINKDGTKKITQEQINQIKETK
jgi:proteasome beta subunit